MLSGSSGWFSHYPESRGGAAHQSTVICRNAVAVVRVSARLHLVDEITDCEGVELACAEHERFLLLVDLFHEDFNTLSLPLFDLNDPVEVLLLVESAALDFALDELVIGSVEILIQRSGDLLQAKRREESVVNALTEGVDINRLAEVAVRIDVLVTLRGCGEAELHRRREVIQYPPPGALVVSAAAVTLINDNEIEEVGRVLAEVGRRFAVLGRSAHKRLKDREEHAPILGHTPFLTNIVGRNPH